MGGTPLRKVTCSLSIMERNLKATTRENAVQAFTEGIQVPWMLMAAFGALSAWVVGAAGMTEPGGNYEPPLEMWLALLGILVVSHLVHRDAGIQFHRMGVRANAFIIGIFGLNLSLFSISLGLVSSGMPWAVSVTSIVGFVTTTAMAGIAYQQAVENVYRA